MAKATNKADKAKTAAAVPAAGAKVTIKDLSEEFGIEARELRAFLRKEGFKAPEIDRPAGTFGPKSKYEWAADSKELAEIKAKIAASLEDEDEAAE